MSEYISKYSGQEIEGILDKANSIQIGLSEENSAIPFNTITVDSITYKVPSVKQLGLYKHTISFSIHQYLGGDGVNNVSLDGGSNIATFDVFTTSSTPLTLDNVFTVAKTLCFSKIEYDKRTSPKTIKYAIMIGDEKHSSTIHKIVFLHRDDETDRLESTTTFYARDFSDTVVEVVAN